MPDFKMTSSLSRQLAARVGEHPRVADEAGEDHADAHAGAAQVVAQAEAEAEPLEELQHESLKKFRRPTPEEVRQKAGPTGSSEVQLPG